MAESARQPQEPQSPDEKSRFLLDRVNTLESGTWNSANRFAR